MLVTTCSINVGAVVVAMVVAVVVIIILLVPKFTAEKKHAKSRIYVYKRISTCDILRAFRLYKTTQSHHQHATHINFFLFLKSSKTVGAAHPGGEN